MCGEITIHQPLHTACTCVITRMIVIIPITNSDDVRYGLRSLRSVFEFIIVAPEHMGRDCCAVDTFFIGIFGNDGTHINPYFYCYYVFTIYLLPFIYCLKKFFDVATIARVNDIDAVDVRHIFGPFICCQLVY